MTEMTKIAGVETPIEVARLINALVDNKGNIDLDNLSETGLAKFTNLDTKITNVQENVNALTTTVNEKIGATVSKAQNGYIKFTNGVIIQWGELRATSYAVKFPVSFSNNNSYMITVVAIPDSKTSTWHTIPVNKNMTGISLYMGQFNSVGTTMDNFIHNWIAIGI